MDKMVTRKDFLRAYRQELDAMWNDDNTDKYNIYGKDFTIHWNGIYCNVGDGATPSNYIIPAIQDCDEELDEEEITQEDNTDIQDIATRIYDLVPPWDREEDAMQETINALQEHPMDIVKYLLDRIDELEGHTAVFDYQL